MIITLHRWELIDFNNRFIPNREGQDLQAGFSLLHDDGSPATPSKQKKRAPHGELHFQKSMFNIASQSVLMFGS
jgi:hypothetical protein